MASTILSDNGVTSGSAGLKTTADSTGVLALQTSTAGGSATTALTIDTSQNVGIGVTPSAWGSNFKAVQVGSAGAVGGQTSAKTLEMASNAYNNSGWKYIGSDYATLYYQYNGYHSWSYASSGTAGNAVTFNEAMRIDSSGNVGIGTTTPSTRLHVQGGQVTDGGLTYNQQLTSTAAYNASPASGSLVSLQYNSGGAYAGMGGWSINKENATSGDYAGYMAFFTRANGGSTTERMRIDSSGNVGIGLAATGDTLLEIYGANSATIYKNVNTGTGSSDGFYVGMAKSSGTDGYVYNRESANVIFGTANAERMRIDSSGNLLIGKTSTAGSANGLNYSPNNYGAGIGSMSMTANTSSNTYTIIQAFSSNVSQYAFYIQWNGQIYAQVTSISSASDATLKTNVRPLETGLSQILALQPRRFDWIDGHAKDVMGFVAQEVQPILPELVTSSKHSIDENGDDVDKLHLAMGDMIPTLVKAIQELKAINDTQAETINALTARIVALESK